VERGAAIVPLFVVDPRLMTGRDAPGCARRRAPSAPSCAPPAPTLVVRRGDAREEVPRAAREAGAQVVHWSDDFTRARHSRRYTWFRSISSFG
jgi:hypothetical protein